MPEQEVIVHKLYDGQTFTAIREGTFSSSTTVSLAIENPANSGKSIVVTTQEVKTDSSAVGQYYRNPDISGGSQSAAASDAIGSGKSSIINVYKDATFSSPDSQTNFPISESGNGDGGLTSRPPILLTEDSTIGIEVESNANDNDILILVVFYETERTVD